jgi:metallo-beta-lactamase family protein
MKVQFLGAAQTVTGSCYMIEANGKRFCVDCGMHQGNKAIEARNRDTAPYRPKDIDFILVTHAHIDHSGLLPRMVREGYAKPIYCTKATGELLELMLKKRHIQEMEAQASQNIPAARPRNRSRSTPRRRAKNRRFFHTVIPQDFETRPGIRVTYYDAAHSGFGQPAPGGRRNRPHTR